ncbi:MAG: PilT/PilU family type 4a pilus ATPase [Chloroflexi bacterium]|nr:PilT/PilU family type 4a pilus ATPase [Chloroflexota bacterium]
MFNFLDLLERAIEQRASDVLIKAGAAPAMRVDGRIVPVFPDKLSPEECQSLVLGIIDSASRDYLLRHTPLSTSGDPLPEALQSDRLIQRLEEGNEIDLSFTVPNIVRVRSNLFLQRGTPGAILRIIPLRPWTVEQLRLPSVIKDLALAPQGLVLVTGPTGSGKSTTMAAMVEHINVSRQANIITIEDPIEYIYEDKRALVCQRQVGTDTKTWASAVHSVLRQNPDVIMIGEMRDLETVRVALMAAEVGHLVLSTLHTISAATTIDRILNMFPLDERQQVQMQLAVTLQGVISQRLVPLAEGPGRIVAAEVMIASPTVRKQIEDGQTAELYSSIREGHHFRMNTMNQQLEYLYNHKLISYETALLYAGNYTELKQTLRRQ